MTDPRDGAGTNPELARLRDAFAASNERAESAAGCPDPDRVWQAVAGALNRDETADLVLHTASCGACAEIWRVAHRMAPAGEPAAAPARAPWGTGTTHRLAILAAAATVIFGVVSVIQFRNPTRSPEESRLHERSAGEAPRIRSLTSEDSALPRSDCRLRWSSMGEGAIYEITVSSETLRVLSRGKHLTDAEYLVPEADLAALPAGSRLLWQVEAILPDGSRITSPTMIALVE